MLENRSFDNLLSYLYGNGIPNEKAFWRAATSWGWVNFAAGACHSGLVQRQAPD